MSWLKVYISWLNLYTSLVVEKPFKFKDLIIIAHCWNPHSISKKRTRILYDI